MPNQPGLLDADGHLWEDYPAIVRRLPKDYRDDVEDGRMKAGLYLFPPFGPLHSLPVQARGFTERRSAAVGPTEWLQFLEDTGIERTVLYPTLALPYGKNRDPRWGKAVSHAYNDWVAETYLGHPSGRFSAMAILPLQDVPAAVTELRRAVTELGMRGAMLPSHSLPTNVASPEYWPLYAEAEALGCALAIHGGPHDGYGLDDLTVFAPAHALGHPFGLLICLAGFVFYGVFDRFPGLRVAFLEGGSAWLMLALERFAESYKAFAPYDDPGLLRLAEGVGVDEYVIELLRAGRVVVGCEGGEHDIEYVIEHVGASPFMYSSDFPHEVTAESCRHELAELAELKISEADRAAITGGTATRFYRMD